MVSLREAPNTPSAVDEKFETAMPQLFHELEAWRRECNMQPPALDDFPVTDRKAVREGLFFFGAFSTLTYVIPAVHMALGWAATVWLYIVLLSLVLSAVAGSYLLLIRSHGIDTAQFWRAIRTAFRSGDNFPFMVAHELLRRDLSSTERLRPYSSALLVAAKDRLSISEDTLRVRLNALVGNPSILVLVGLLSAIGSSWQNFHASNNTFALVLLLTSVGAFGCALYGSKLQLSLAELARCRALLSLEISRRTAGFNGLEIDAHQP